MNEQHATLVERMLFQEAQNRAYDKRTPFRGVVVFRDLQNPDGPPVIVENLVIQNGREIALRKLFNLYPTGDGTLANFNKRIICGFGVGDGGTPLGAPTSPITPTPADTGLSNAVIFQTTLTSTLAGYIDNAQVGLDYNWNKKAFTSPPVLTVNTSTNEIYVKMTLGISALDCRGSNVNEIVLYTGIETTPGSGVFGSFIAFSRLTFPTEAFPLLSNKAFEYDYYLYV